MEQDVKEELINLYEQIVELNKQNAKLTKLIKDHISTTDVYIRK